MMTMQKANNPSYVTIAPPPPQNGVEANRLPCATAPVFKHSMTVESCQTKTRSKIFILRAGFVLNNSLFI